MGRKKTGFLPALTLFLALLRSRPRIEFWSAEFTFRWFGSRRLSMAKDHGFIPLLIKLAAEKGASAYVGEGLNRWLVVHRLDAAQLYRLVLEKGAAGRRYHGAAEEGVRFREIAEVIGGRLSVSVVSVKGKEAADHFGWFEHFAAIDAPA